MESRDLSKLQIRAEVMMILQQLSAYDETPKSEQDKYLKQLKSISDRNTVLEMLIKELTKTDIKKAEIISYFLIELGNLEQLKDILWTFIKDPNSPDELKDLVNIILRELGDDTDAETYLSYLDDPKKIIDKETQKLLEIATVNPEAQIDFLDFLFSLPESEQINLVQSLRIDYKGEYLVVIISSALEYKPAESIQEILVEILGETRSSLAVSPLINVINYSDNEKIRKIAKKSLNMLKLAGINIEESSTDTRGSEICRISRIHECYVSPVDGMGNQGLIFSRIKPNNDVLMFSVVLNDIEGIIDCFGFYGISLDDFNKIINRFQEESSRIPVSAEYCKYFLEKAEHTCRINNLSIPYEYIAWKMLIYDIELLNISIEEQAMDWADKSLETQGKSLYKYPDFKHWFLEDDDNENVKDFISNLIQNLLNDSEYTSNPEKLRSYLEERISEIIPVVFDEDLRSVYCNRLLNNAYLLHTRGFVEAGNIASSTALCLKETNIENNPFIRQLFRKTIYEGVLRYQYNLIQSNQPQNIFKRGSNNSMTNSGTDLNTTVKNLDDIIITLCNIWQEENK